MSEIERIVDQFAREHDGDPWHGSPLSEILAGITAAQAARRPIAGGHTVWEVVLHVTGWKREALKRVRGGPASEPESGDWPEPAGTDDRHWADALAGLDAAHRELLAAIRALPETWLFEPTNDPRNRALGSGVTYYQLLHGLVQHDVYHAGQIAILKKG